MISFLILLTLFLISFTGLSNWSEDKSRNYINRSCCPEIQRVHDP